MKSSMIPKHKKHEENYTKVHDNQTAQFIDNRKILKVVRKIKYIMYSHKSKDGIKCLVIKVRMTAAQVYCWASGFSYIFQLGITLWLPLDRYNSPCLRSHWIHHHPWPLDICDRLRLQAFSFWPSGWLGTQNSPWRSFPCSFCLCTVSCHLSKVLGQILSPDYATFLASTLLH